MLDSITRSFKSVIYCSQRKIKPMKKLIPTLLLITLVLKSAYADVLFVGKNNVVSPYSIQVNKTDIGEIEYVLTLNTSQEVRNLGNQKSYSLRDLNRYYGSQKKKIQSSKVIRTVFTVGGVAVGAVAGGYLAAIAGAATGKNAAGVLVGGLGMLGVGGVVGGYFGGAGGKSLYDAIYLSPVEKGVRSYLADELVTQDKTIIFKTDDVLLTIADFERGLEEVTEL